MTKKEFLRSVSNGRRDVLQLFLDVLVRQEVEYCVIGGLAVNAYAEPVVSLDLDIVIFAKKAGAVCEALKEDFQIQHFAHSINLSSSDSDLRIQIQTDHRYQSFLERAQERDVLGYRMMVASVEDVLTGKLWAYMDDQRRRSKRQKDLADIMRLVEGHDMLADLLPPEVRKLLD
jgi:hypothetical protein